MQTKFVLPAAAFVLIFLGVVAPMEVDAQQLAGERLFRQRCASCHTLQPDQNRVGAHLSGAFGRTAGQVDGARYSEALRNTGIVWDDQSLGRFLANPRRAVSGTTMTVAVPNARERQAIVLFLKGAR